MQNCAVVGVVKETIMMAIVVKKSKERLNFILTFSVDYLLFVEKKFFSNFQIVQSELSVFIYMKFGIVYRGLVLK
jgi:hypothetical protein